MPRPMSSAIALVLAASVGMGACHSTSAEAQSRSNAVSARDRQLGAQAHPQILAEFGGAYNGPGVALVNKVGKAIAVQSGIASTGSECTVTLLNSTVVNAFAIPGCYIYVTRGLLAVMNDEAELASVLGHEIGHVAARHAQRRQQASTLSGLGAILGAVLTGSSAVGQLLQQGAQLYTLRFSRQQEFQADDLGIQYMARAGYDPYASADMLESLEDEAQLETRLRGQQEAQMMPSWARTHPLTTDRVTRATTQARKTGLAPGARARNAASYYAAVDGMLYGDDPSQGFVDGSTFAHPSLRLAFRAPEGFYLNNASDAVTIQGPSGQQAQFSGGRLAPGESLDSYAERVAQALVGQAQGVQVGRMTRTTINGLDAVILPLRAATRSGALVDVDIAAYRFDDNTAYHFITIAPAGRSSGFESLVHSFRRLSPEAAASLRPRVIDVVTVRPGDTLRSLVDRMAYRDYKLERFLAINDRDANQPLRPGEQVKLVVYAAR